MSFLLNDAKIIMILLGSDDEGIFLKLHLDGRLLARCATRNLKWGGCFGGVTPNWNSLHLELERFFA